VLAIDANQNGRIDGPGELFGDQTGYANGFEALGALDINGDGVINSEDKAFSELTVWIDSNSNGNTDAGELHSLTDLGITSINLAYTEVTDTDNGNEIRETATFIMGGDSYEIADVYFATDLMNSEYVGDYTLDPLALLLPDERGYGVLPDLYISMSMD